MSYLLRCKNCGYGISDSDDLRCAKWYAETINSCGQCYSKKFEIVKRKSEISIFGDEFEGQNDDEKRDHGQQSLDDF